jgi:molybdopterin-containing oxidoreductase family iron-sulfur binding subunit
MLGDSEKRYWQNLDERGPDAAGPRDEPGPEPDDGRVDRRGFLSIMGLSAAAMTAACSRSPAGKIIPYLQKPEEVTPGLASHYASSCGACSASCGILLKTRDGRPIKVEGNELHPISGGGVCAVGQASILSLYDAGRARGPSAAGREVSWAELDAAIVGALARIKAGGRAIRVVAPSDLGPTADAALAQLLAAHPGARRVRHDASDLGPLADAHLATHGVRAIPAVRMDRAAVIVGVSADFLGTWLAPVALTRQYTRGRDPAARRMSRHVQLEPKLTLTGSNADQRVTMAPSDTVPVLAAIARLLPAGEGEALDPAIAAVRAPEVEPRILAAIAAELGEARGKALLLCGSDDPAAQILANHINERIGAYGTTLDLAAGVARPEGVMSFAELLDELAKKQVGAVLFWGVNPVYDHPRGARLAELLREVELTVSTADRRDETGSVVRYLAPDHHPLESWGDVEPERGVLGVRQPAVAPLFETRSACESFLRWAGAPMAHDDFMRARWEAAVFPVAKDAPASFQAFWDRSVRDGFAVVAAPPPAPLPRLRPGAAAALAGHPATRPAERGLELFLYEKVGLRDGRLGNNGWLHELPDPISKVTWANYACLSPALAAELGAKEGSMVTIRAGDRSITAPALIEPGVHRRVVAIAVGYGRTHAGPIGNAVGVNAFALAGASSVQLVVTPGEKPLAKSQTQASLEGRPIVKEASLQEYLADPAAGNEREPGQKRHLSMWSGHAHGPHQWAMNIDLSACTGCSACLVACQAENNVPIVGEVEVRRRREMHWIRIDRYFSGTPDNPEVVHQPMMCQHCENAPCETVCPVLATVHSSEGLNQQVYNRCVGTRYCANNCPTKVRRFNWFDYPHDDPVERMVLNPDVVVRSRGVMEKCSLCVQRIQEGKATARAEGRRVRDGDIRTACQESCPAQAITFGDADDPGSRVAALARDPRAYRVLEELNIGPSVSYLARIRNTKKEGGHG